MKTKITWIIVAVFIIAIGVLSYFYIFNNGFSADSNVTEHDQIDLASLAGSQYSYEQNGVELIGLMGYTKNQIEKALSTIYTNENTDDILSEESASIIAEIYSGTRELIEIAVDDEGEDSSEEVTRDIIIGVVDLNGEMVTSIGEESVYSLSADAFIFNSNVDDKIRQIFLEQYEKVEFILGDRVSSDKIPVKIESEPCQFNYYSYSTGIGICKDNQNSANLIAHEITHAFMNPHTLDHLWSEGIAEIVSYLAIDEDAENLKDQTRSMEIENFPSIPHIYNNTHSFSAVYNWGFAMLMKLYVEDNNILRELYKQIHDYNGDRFVNNLQLIEMSSRVVDKVENISTKRWFNSFYPWIKMEANMYGDLFLYKFTHHVLAGKKNTIYIKFDEDNTEEYKIEVYDFQGRIIDKFNQSEDDGNWYIDAHSWKVGESTEYYNNYNGLLRFEITVGDDKNSKRVQYFPKSSLGYKDSRKAGVWGIVVGGASSAVVRNIDSGWSETVEVENGLFHTTSSEAKEAGRYLVEVRNGAGEIIKEHYFNKMNISGYVTLISLQDPDCNSEITNKLSNSSSTELTIKSERNCVKVISRDFIPLTRVWGVSNVFKDDNLNPQTVYRYQIFDSYVGRARMALSKTVKTKKDRRDFVLSSLEASSNADDKKFHILARFNKAINDNSIDSSNFSIKLINQYFDYDDSDLIDVKTKKVKNKRLRFVPRSRLYNNARYLIFGLDKITDIYNEPLVFAPYGALFNDFKFMTDLVGGTRPRFALNNYAIAQDDKLVATPNFTFTEVDFISEAKVVNWGDYSKVESDIQMVGNNIEIRSDNFVVGNNYFLVIPWTVDSLNNVVEEQYLTFKIE